MAEIAEPAPSYDQAEQAAEMYDLPTARPANPSRRRTSCMQCGEALTREGRSRAAADFHHDSTKLNRCSA